MALTRLLKEYERDGVRVVAREHLDGDIRTYDVEASVASEFDSRRKATSEGDAVWKAERLFDAIYQREYGEGPRSPSRPVGDGLADSADSERG